MELSNQSDILINLLFGVQKKISLNSLYSRDLFFFNPIRVWKSLFIDGDC